MIIIHLFLKYKITTKSYTFKKKIIMRKKNKKTRF